MSRAADFYGANSLEPMFPEGRPLAMTPWPMAGRRKDVKDYDKDKVTAAISDPSYPLTDLDPRDLKATQPNVTRAGVAHYMGGDHEKTGRTYADQDNAGNRIATVYRRVVPGREPEHLILTGHHRGVTALLRGQQFRARVVEGGWGGPRQ